MEHTIRIDAFTREILFDNQVIYKNGRVFDAAKYNLVNKIYKGTIADLMNLLKEGDVYKLEIIDYFGKRKFIIKKEYGEIRIGGVGRGYRKI